MKKLFYILLIVFLPLLSFAQNTFSQQTEVMMKMALLGSALLNRGSVSLSNLLSNNVTYGHVNGLIQTKSQLIDCNEWRTDS